MQNTACGHSQRVQQREVLGGHPPFKNLTGYLKSFEQILSFFVAQLGERLLLTPEDLSLNPALYNIYKEHLFSVNR